MGVKMLALSVICCRCTVIGCFNDTADRDWPFSPTILETNNTQDICIDQNVNIIIKACNALSLHSTLHVGNVS